ncbi:MAG: pantoate--beta-alanine ligase [Deltaproteobacteria bacterium]|jgi:pantoate--beta-alanine ligase|nr:pantoate--beta-alanine ligase [Deltaproteobacteria bacterium]
MQVIKQIKQTQATVLSWRDKGLKVGVVPTMGYLHDGHISLIKRAAAENDRVLVSIFVNPTQFAPTEDLATYPRDMQRDMANCEKNGVHVIFSPDTGEMYPNGFATQVELPSLSANLCGRSRPTHFRGVCTVCLKLFNITMPHKAYFGLKDAQQFFILKRLVKDIDLDLELVPCPIVREPDGLAMSSRNAYLQPNERQAALIINAALTKAQDLIKIGERRAAVISKLIESTISGEKLATIDYIECVDTQTLSPVTDLVEETLVAVAVRIGRCRLIDNFIFPFKD